jgi:predicted NBD/HSP70 family sugar kinase
VQRKTIPTVLVIEVGGTNLRAARFDPTDRALSDRVHAATPNILTGDRAGEASAMLSRALRTIGDDAMRGGAPGVVSVAYPGPLDPGGVALATPTVLGGERAFPVRRECEALWPEARVFVLNDMTAAGYRYVDRGLRDFCIVTVGSGVGHKVFLDGEPLVGRGGRGGEIGHLRVDPHPDAPVCDCGGRGHLGGIASGRGVVRAARLAAERDPASFGASALAVASPDPSMIGSRALAEAFGTDDAWTRALVASTVRPLGQALAAIHLAVGVERFVLTGGFAFACGEPYRRMLAETADASSWDVGLDWNEAVALGIPDDDQGMIGAGLFAARQLGTALTETRNDEATIV